MHQTCAELRKRNRVLLDGRFGWASRAGAWEVELAALLRLRVRVGREHGRARAGEHGERVALRVQRASWPARLHAALEPPVITLVRHVRHHQVETTLCRLVQDPATKHISFLILKKRSSTIPNGFAHYFLGSTDSSRSYKEQKLQYENVNVFSWDLYV